MSNQVEKSDRRSFRETYRSTSQDATKEPYTSASPSTSKDVYKGGSPSSSKGAYKSDSPKTSKDPYNISSSSTSKDLFSSSPGTSKDSYSSSSQSSPRDPFKVSQDNSSMSMKVNVRYRGIVYRVRGIKVLCSVVTAVILLLVAIVGLGVWMLVSAYGEEKAGLVAAGSNSTSFLLSQDLEERGEGNSPTPSTIDFNAPSVTLEELSVAAVIPSNHPDENHQVGEAIGHFQGVTPGKELTSSSRLPGPDPAFGLFSGIFDLNLQSQETTDLAPTPSGIPTEEQLVPEDSDIEYSETNPVAILPPTGQYDYDGSQVGYVRDSNLRVESFEAESSPVYPAEYPPSVLPENIPRDIDPTLLELGLPYHSPPSIAPGPAPPRRRNNPRFRGGIRRIPPGTRRSQQPVRPDSIRPPYDRSGVNERPAFGQRVRYAQQPYDRYDSPAYDTWQPSFPPYEYDQVDHQEQRPQNSEYLPSEERSTVREAQTESFEKNDKEVTAPSGIDYSLLQQFGANRGVTIPEGFTVPPGFKVPENVGDLQDKDKDGNRRISLAPGGYFEDMMHYYNKHEKTATTTPPTQATSTDDFSQRKGVSETDDHPDYVGPPVVGYGEHPYRHATPSSASTEGVFEYFWDVYDSKDHHPAQHDDRGPAPEDYMEYSQPMHPPRIPRPRPNVRGGMRNGQGYPIPMRPDAQAPPVLSPDRRLWVGPDRRPRPQMAVRPPPTSTIPPLSTPDDQSFLGPLQDVYEYSQRLASSLLSFPATLYTKINESKAEYMRNEVELLEDYNKVFKNSDITSTDVLPDMYNDKPDRNERVMIIDTEKIRSLNPFELSLITWTFLDFWEFLIEKVGTLSEEDLQLLEMRLERLRQDKDRRMTKNLVTATMQQVSEGAKLNSQDAEQMRSLTESLLNSSSIAEGGEDDKSSSVAVAEARMWDPLGLFNSEQRVKFMEFAMKVVFRFGRVYLKKRYALDCMMLLFCKDLNADTKKEGMDGVAAKVKSVGLKVLTEKDTRNIDTINEVWRAVTAWDRLQCDVMFPKCDGPKALEIVNEVAVGAGK